MFKFQNGPFLAAASLSGGIDYGNTRRRLTFGGLNLTAVSSNDVRWISGQLRAAYLFEWGRSYAKPLVDVNLTYLNRGAVTETGGGAANLSIAAGYEAVFSVMPAVEFGGELELSDKVVIQPFSKFGFALNDHDNSGLTARFAGAPAGAGSFITRAQFDRVQADIEAGFTLINIENGSTLRAGYEGRFGKFSQSHGGYIKAAFGF